MNETCNNEEECKECESGLCPLGIIALIGFVIILLIIVFNGG